MEMKLPSHVVFSSFGKGQTMRQAGLDGFRIHPALFDD